MHRIRYSVDDEQLAGARLRAHIFAHRKNDFFELFIVVSDKFAHSAIARLVVNINTVITIFSDGVTAICRSPRLNPLVRGLAIDLELVRQIVQENRECHLCTLELLDCPHILLLLLGKAVPLTPDGDDVHRVRGTLKPCLIGCSVGCPGAVPSECKLVFCLLICAQRCVICIIAKNRRLFFRGLYDNSFRTCPIRTSGYAECCQKACDRVFYNIFHIVR